MLLGEMIVVALQSIRANLFRGFLTMLGIIIGVGSVITMVSLGSGAQAAIDEQIESLGANILSINSRGMMRHGVAQERGDLGHHVVVARVVLHGGGVAPHVHGHQRRAVLRGMRPLPPEAPLPQTTPLTHPVTRLIRRWTSASDARGRACAGMTHSHLDSLDENENSVLVQRIITVSKILRESSSVSPFLPPRAKPKLIN